MQASAARLGELDVTRPARIALGKELAQLGFNSLLPPEPVLLQPRSALLRGVKVDRLIQSEHRPAPAPEDPCALDHRFAAARDDDQIDHLAYHPTAGIPAQGVPFGLQA